jgi:hypothetical protein
VKTNTTIKSNSSISNSSAKTNTTVANNTSSALSANATKANATNTTGAASSSSFARTRKYTNYYPEKLVWFCTDRNTAFYRMHWQEYFGGDCSVPKPKEGFVDLGNYTATGCTMIPCCINGPSNEYSRSYDYFECGYN